MVGRVVGDGEVKRGTKRRGVAAGVANARAEPGDRLIASSLREREYRGFAVRCVQEEYRQVRNAQADAKWPRGIDELRRERASFVEPGHTRVTIVGAG
ncbi:MAG: hypothetical protein ACJ796_22310 [Gemmatimonadaceae bacterium]